MCTWFVNFPLMQKVNTLRMHECLQMGQRIQHQNVQCVSSVELYVILMALEWVEHVKPRRVLICSYSASILWSIKHVSSCNRQDLLYEIIKKQSSVVRRGTMVVSQHT